MKLNLFRVVVPLLVIGCLHAGSATFLPDGRRVVRVDEETLRIETPEKEVASELLRLPPGFSPEGMSVASTADEVIVASRRLAHAWHPATQRWRNVWTPPEGQAILDVAADPRRGLVVFVTTTEDGSVTWWALSKEAKVPGKVFNRRANGAANPIFDPFGNLYFTLGGDVWKGSLEAGDHEDVPFVLSGNRVWPVASLETGPGNSSSTGAHTILPLKDQLLVELSRMGGSGWGNLVRMRNVDAFEAGLALKWDELEECTAGCDAAVSADGVQALVFIRSSARWFKVDTTNGNLSPLARSGEKTED